MYDFSSKDEMTNEELGEINTVVCSQDKQKILLGNTLGRTFILDAKNFTFKDTFKYTLENRSIFHLAGNKNL